MLRAKVAGFSRDAVLYGLGNALGRVAGLIMLPILTRVFSTGDYGAIDILSVSYTFLLIAAKLGVPSGLQRFYFRVEGEDRRELITSCGLFLALVGVAAGTAVAALSPWITGAIGGEDRSLRLGVVALAFCLPFEALWDYSLLLLRMRRRAGVFSALNVVRIILVPTSTFVLVVTLRQGIAGVFMARWISLLILTSAVLVLTRAEWTRKVSWATMRRVLVFALPGHPGLLTRSLMNVLPQYLLASVAPISAVGLYGIAFRLTTLLKVMVGSFNLAWNPFAYQNEGAADEQRIYEFAFRGFFAVLAMLGLGLAVLAEDLLRILSTPEFFPGAKLVPGLTLYFLADGLTVILSTILYTRDRVRYDTYLNLLRVVAFLGLSAVLLPPLRAQGLVLAMAASAVVYLVAYVWSVRQVFPIHVPWIPLTVVVSLAGLSVFALRDVGGSFALRVGIKTIGVMVYGLIVLRLVFTARERGSLRSSLSSRFSRQPANG